jgi:hypothetical protein
MCRFLHLDFDLWQHHTPTRSCAYFLARLGIMEAASRREEDRHFHRGFGREPAFLLSHEQRIHHEKHNDKKNDDKIQTDTSVHRHSDGSGSSERFLSGVYRYDHRQL